MKNGLKIRAINTEEPTLEDAFIAITGNHTEEFSGQERVV
jgi:hypothetical protein